MQFKSNHQHENHLQSSGSKVLTEKDSHYWKIAAQLQAAEKDLFQVMPDDIVTRKIMFWNQ